MIFYLPFRWTTQIKSPQTAAYARPGWWRWSAVAISTALDNKQLEKELNKLKKDIGKLEESIAGQESKKSPLIQHAQKLEQKMKSARSEVERYRAAWAAGVSGADKEQSTAIAKTHQLEAEHAKVVGQIDKIDAKLLPAYEKMSAMKERAGGIAKGLGKASINSGRMGEAVQRAGKSLDRFKMRLKEVVRSALVFTLITQALAQFRNWMGKVIKSNAEASAAVAKLKGALLTLAQPLIEVIIPAFTEFVNILSMFIGFIAGVLSIIFGSTAKESADAAEGLYDETSAIESVGNAAKKASKDLAGFDKINRLSSGNEVNTGGINTTIKPDFSAIKELPNMLKNFLADLSIVIEGIKFSYAEGKLAENRDAWVIALSAILGAVIGGMFGGILGTVIGLMLGATIGIVSCTFLNKTKNPSKYKEIFIVVLASILGAILGYMFGGLIGGVIGLLLGATISIISLEFTKGGGSTWDAQNTIIVVLSAILGAVLGGVFGGLAGGVIGFLLGALISFIAIKFNDGKFDKDAAIASLRIALFAILGLVFGAMFGGLAGGIIGLVLGMTIGFATVAFDKELSTRTQSFAQKALKVALTTIIGALIGAVFGGGVFGGILGGVIGLAFGLAITLTDASIEDKTGFSDRKSAPINTTSKKSYSSKSTTRSAIPVLPGLPRLATGAVIPPNREFMAVLGDQKRGTNIEAPMSTIEQGVENVLRRMGISSGQSGMTLVLDGNLAALAGVLRPYMLKEGRRIGVNLVKK